MIVVAVAIFLQTAAGMLAEVAGAVCGHRHLAPPTSLSQKSIVDHHGFRMPQIDKMFLRKLSAVFITCSFAQALLLADNIVAAKVANAMIYLSFPALTYRVRKTPSLRDRFC